MPVPPARPVVSVSRKAHSHQERASAGAARQAAGLGIEKSPLVRRDIANRAIGNRFEQVRGQLRERTDIGAAVAAVAGIKRISLKMFSVSGLDFLARHPFVNVPATRLRRRFVFLGALLHHARHALAQDGELLL